MSWACDMGDGPSVYREAEVVARKEHPCVECNAPILKGEKHLRYSGCWDGSWGGGRQHLLCRDACVWIRDVLNEECIPFGALFEWWEEHRYPGALEEAWGAKPEEMPRLEANWKLGARMYAMAKCRERLAADAKREEPANG